MKTEIEIIRKKRRSSLKVLKNLGDYRFQELNRKFVRQQWTKRDLLLVICREIVLLNTLERRFKKLKEVEKWKE